MSLEIGQDVFSLETVEIGEIGYEYKNGFYASKTGDSLKIQGNEVTRIIPQGENFLVECGRFLHIPLLINKKGEILSRFPTGLGDFIAQKISQILASLQTKKQETQASIPE